VANRLAQETSPYLLQHADNPVDWYPWGEEAFARAREEDKPILLSIGYSACHWCHVMAHESFENAYIAKLMNEHYVNIKVDREERPDVDAIYMDAVVGITGSGGWPLTVFLKPNGEPFFGGTYFPPEPKKGMRGLGEMLLTLSNAWKEKRDEIDKSATGLTEHMRSGARLERVEGVQFDESLLYGALESLMVGFDWEWGGWGTSPKFPAGPGIEFALRLSAGEVAQKTLDGMAAGGMYDLVGGGFHRYSVDERWLVPHFEKMLYDNAQLAVAYLHGWQVLGKERYREVVEETVDYLLRELALEGGGFASAQDADTDGVEGLTFTWKRDEGIPDQFLHVFEGGRFVLRGELDPELRASLFEQRSRRKQPARDDKAIASWNGLTLAALAECGRVLDRSDWLDSARQLGEFLLGPLSTAEGRLHRTWREGVAKGTGYLEDYADVAHGLYELHVATGELRWLEEANRLARLAVELFHDEEHGGFFQTPVDGEQLVARRKDFDDHPAPSGNSMLAYVLLRLARIYGDDELEERAVSVFRLIPHLLVRAPSAFAWTLVALDLYLAPRRELAVVGPPDSEVARAALAHWDPKAVIAFGPAEGVPLLEGKTLVDGKPAVYICQNFACQAPVTDPAALQPVDEDAPADEPVEEDAQAHS
jgi:uncharacterized protein YyaL (SSP411 family)